MTLPRLEDKPDGVNTFDWILKASQEHRNEAAVGRCARQQIELIRRKEAFAALRDREDIEEVCQARRAPRFG